MRLKVLAVILLATFALAGTAQAQTTIVEPIGSHFPYQRWIEESQVPTPDVTIEVIEQPSGNGCPGREQKIYLACTSPAEHKIWIAATEIIVLGISPREKFMHEMGHNFDTDVMPEWARQRFEELFDLGGSWWAPPGEPTSLYPQEYFADVYAQCAVLPHIPLRHFDWFHQNVFYGSGPVLAMRAPHNKACRMIQNL